jgi:hypothetical protein
MFIFEQNGKATVCQDGQALLRAAGHAIDNQIALVQNGQLIGYGRDMHEVLNSKPTIERLNAEATMTKSMAKSMPVKPVTTARNNRYAEQVSAIQNNTSELQVMLKSMTAQRHSLVKEPAKTMGDKRLLFGAA